MDSELRMRAKDIEPGLVGRRLREARIRAGLTQGEVAGADASTAYISRIESGVRRPSLDLLERLSQRLETTLADLLAPASAAPSLSEDDQRHRLELDYAELALRTGDIDTALSKTEALRADGAISATVLRDVTYVYALALESAGRTNEAINELEDLTHTPADLRLVEVFTALTRCYRESGDLHRAAAVGQRAEAALVEDDQLWAVTEGIRLTVTVSLAYFDQGDVNHAIRICTRALELADSLNSAAAKAGSYWNLSIYHQDQGRIQVALEMARRALEMLDPADDARNVARLRNMLGRMELQADEPDIELAKRNLLRSRQEMAVTHVAPVDKMYNLLGLAQAHFLSEDLPGACHHLDLVFGMGSSAESGQQPLAEAHALRGRIELKLANVEDAVQQFRLAIDLLNMIGSDRSVGELWVELAQLFESLGMVTEAMSAYRGAAATQGLIARNPRLIESSISARTS